VTLQELEEIKTSARKDPEIKYAARQLLRVLDENAGSYEVHIFTNDMLAPMEEKNFIINDDLRILATALDYDKNVHPDEVVFVTNDLALKNIANLFFGEDSIESVYENEIDGYTGYKEAVVNNDQLLIDLYQNPSQNYFELLTN
jgi:predicted ribonuclease YlaK